MVRREHQNTLDAYESADTAACPERASRENDIDTVRRDTSGRVVRVLIERGATADHARGVEQLMDGVSRLLLTIHDPDRVAGHGISIAARTVHVTDNNPELVY